MRKLETWEKAQEISMAVVVMLGFSWLFYFILNYESQSHFARFITLFSLVFPAFPLAILVVVFDAVGLAVWHLTGKKGDPPRPSLT